MTTCHEPLLEGEGPRSRHDERAQLVVAHRKQRALDAEPPCGARREGRQRLAGSKRLRPQQMQAEVPVAELEPVVAAEARHRLERVPRLVGTTPAELLVSDPGERVEDAVEIGRDVHAENLDVVPDVHDGRHVPAAECLDQRPDELRAAEPAAQDGDVQARTSRALRVFGPTCCAMRMRSSHVSTSSRRPGRSSCSSPNRSALPGP